MNYLTRLDYRHAMKLVERAQEEERKEIYYKWWLARYPMYTKDNYESFEDFYDKHTPKKIDYDTRSKDEIMEDILEIPKVQ